MKNYSCAILFAAACTANVSAETARQATEGFTLVWQELFDGTELNRDRWNIEVNGDGGGNAELQYYTDRAENVSVKDGCLVLTARREDYNGKNFTSGRINSQKRIAFTHGMIEASIKLPKTANGLWPAFWMMGNDYQEVGWPRCGETDIVEMGNVDGINSGCQDRYFNGASHWGERWDKVAHNAKAANYIYSLQDDEFHLFTVVWDENGIQMFLDRDKNPDFVPYYSMTCPCDEPENPWSPGNYFHKDNFILFNLAVGGNFPGIHNADGITALNEENGQEASMYVDYVKIYQKGVPSEHTAFTEPGDDIAGIISAEITAEDDYRIDYDGNTLTSNSPELTLFTPAGRCVAKSATGRIRTDGLTSGIYMAHNGYRTRKILVNN